ncbi:MAG: hypothetical protein QXV62_07555, partial [Nitrososphaerota archaeon]
NISFYPSQLPRPIKFLSNRGLVVVAEGLEEAIKAVGEMLAALPVLRTRLSRIASSLVKGMDNPAVEISDAVEKLLR